jgi:hypothetical protein
MRLLVILTDLLGLFVCIWVSPDLGHVLEACVVVVVCE